MNARALLSALAVLLAQAAGTAHAEEVNTQCVVRGVSPAKANTKIYDQRDGGKAIASIPGAQLSMRITGFAAKPSSKRVHVKTGGTKKPYVVIEGWADFDRFRFFAKRDLRVRGGNLWITKGQELELTKVTGDRVTVKKALLGTAGQTVRATVSCDALTLELLDPGANEPDRARTYQTKRSVITLYDRPNGSEVITLRMQEDTRKVFWGTQVRGGFVHVLARSDVTIDAWARHGDLVPLGPHAEVYDPSYVSPRPWPIKKLAMEDPPDELVATDEIPVYPSAANGSSIGVVQKGAKFYPMEVSGEWTAILPTDLAVLPPDSGGFWVRSSSLPQ